MGRAESSAVGSVSSRGRIAEVGSGAQRVDVNDMGEKFIDILSCIPRPSQPGEVLGQNSFPKNCAFHGFSLRRLYTQCTHVAHIKKINEGGKARVRLH